MELSKEGVKSVYIAPRPNKAPSAFCIFEYVYFARPDSIFEGMYPFVIFLKSLFIYFEPYGNYIKKSSKDTCFRKTLYEIKLN